MKKKYTNKNKRVVNTFADGGAIASGIGGATAMLTAGIDAGMKNAEIKDTSAEETQMKSLENTQFGGGSMDDLASQFNTMALGRTNYTKDELRGLSGGQMALNTINGVLEGAAGGASTGNPYAAIAGAAVGLAGGIGGIIAGGVKAERKADELNAKATEANRLYMNNFSNSVSNLHNTMFNKALLNIAAKGGPIFTHGGVFDNDIIHINNGSTHELNPQEGVQIGVDNQGIPNLVEEGEVIWKDYVFSNRMKVPDSVKKKLGLKGKRELTYADAAKKFEDKERPNDPITKDTTDKSLSMLASVQEQQRQMEYMQQQMQQQQLQQQSDMMNTEYPYMYAKGGRLGNLYSGIGNKPNLLEGFSDISNAQNTLLTAAKNRVKQDFTSKPALAPLKQYPKEEGYKFGDFTRGIVRYMPVLGSGLQAFSDAIGLTNKPDYSAADMMLNSTKNLKQASYEPLGDYLTFKPLDRNYYNNQLLAQSNATRGTIQNQAINSAAAMAGLANADYNSQLGFADTARKSEEFNRSQEQAIGEFNRGTNQYNSQAAQQASIANMKNNELMMKGIFGSAEARQKEDLASSNTISANRNAFREDFAGMANDLYNRDQADMLIKSGTYGTLSQKPSHWTDKEWEEYLKNLSNKSAKGGKLNKKRRGGLTY